MAQLVKSKGDKKPDLMSVFYTEHKIPTYAAINVNVTKDNDTYYWDEIVLPEFAINNIKRAPDNIKKDVLIAHIIKAYYDDNKMTAIINNYLLDSDNEIYKKDFLDMQKIRKLAKETSKYIVDNKLF